MSFLRMPVAATSAATILLAAMQALAGLAILHGTATRAQAAEPLAFTIPAEDGYGIAACMTPGSACGQVMANTWCEAHGHLRAIAFGGGGDVTGAIATTGGAPLAEGAVLIRCGD